MRSDLIHAPVEDILARKVKDAASSAGRFQAPSHQCGYWTEEHPGADHAMIERIECGSVLLAIILRSTFEQEGIAFLTPANFSQQLGYMKRPAGYVIAPHVHNPVKREVQYTKEVLFVRRGRLRVDFYDEQKRYLHSRFLHTGDVLLLAYGGHGFEMLEECEIIEVKQGPYAGEGDKERFEAIAAELVTIGE